MIQASFAKLDPREEHFQIPSHHEGLSLFLRYLPALRETPAHKKVVLYVHGGTFPSGLSIAHRFDGVSLLGARLPRLRSPLRSISTNDGTGGEVPPAGPRR